jgi:hypothetical protein
VSGLAKVYRNAKITPTDDTFDSFIQGFNMENPLCDFVNAGNGKECTDEKLKGQSQGFPFETAESGLIT